MDPVRALRQRLIVVGAPSPKFEHERDHEALERAVARYDVRHPVLDVPERTTWDQYGARARPTLVLVDPEGYATVAGEGNAPVLEKTIARMIEEHREPGTLNETPVEVLPPRADAGSLRLPGKVAAGPLSPRVSSAPATGLFPS